VLALHSFARQLQISEYRNCAARGGGGAASAVRGCVWRDRFAMRWSEGWGI